MIRPRRWLLFLLPGLLLAGSLWAATGDGFDLSWFTIDGGGGPSVGGGFTLEGTVAQPDGDLLQGDGFTLQGGFWGGACPPLWPAPAVTIAYQDSFELAWPAVTGAGSYDVYRASDNPYFNPAAPYAEEVVSPWTDPDGSGGGRRFYLVRAIGGCGAPADSGRLGVFEFALVPGS